jgi:hypothetical protein
MKALTLRPHWAWLVVNGYRDNENCRAKKVVGGRA